MDVSFVVRAIGEIGGPSAVARARGLKSPWSVSKWARVGVPAEHVIWLSERTGWQITPHQLAPQFYPHPDDGLPVERRGAGREAA